MMRYYSPQIYANFLAQIFTENQSAVYSICLNQQERQTPLYFFEKFKQFHLSVPVFIHFFPASAHHL